MKQKRGGKALLKAVEVFDLPGEAAFGVPRVTVTGASKVHIENHKGLLEYGPQAIVVNTPGMMVKLRGERLEISAMSDLELVVTGDLAGVDLIV